MVCNRKLGLPYVNCFFFLEGFLMVSLETTALKECLKGLGLIAEKNRIGARAVSSPVERSWHWE